MGRLGEMKNSLINRRQGDAQIRPQVIFTPLPVLDRLALWSTFYARVHNCVEMVTDLPNEFFSACAFIGFVLCMIPLPWHLEAWNTGTCLYMVWTGLACLNQFINSVAWNTDVIDKAPAWCDISAKFIVGSAVAIPAASLCINRRLYHIAACQTVTKTRAQKQRDVMIDLAIGLGIPALEMILHVIVQSNPYMLIEELGCFPSTLNSPPTFVIVDVWPIVIGLVSAGYCIMTIRELSLRRAQFKEFLAVNRNLSSSRYFRLMGLAGIELFCTVPLACYSMYLNVSTTPVIPYVNWDTAHANFYDIPQLPAAIWRQEPILVTNFELSRYFIIICALAFFAFFGFADEARRNYRLAYVSVAKKVGLSTGSMSATGTWTANGSSSRSATMPVFITQQTEKKRDSLASFSSRMSLPDYGGALADLKKESFSPTATSAGSVSKESLPRCPVDLDNVPLPTLPEAAFDGHAPPRYVSDAGNAI